MDILVKLVEGFWNKYENRLINGTVAHEKATSKLNISPEKKQIPFIYNRIADPIFHMC